MTSTYQVRACINGVQELITITREYPRYNPPNPYTNSTFTTEQLNMRRKAEILQYKNMSVLDSSNTLNSNFARLVSGKRFTNRARSQPCENVKHPASSSNVPGRKLLFLDSTVPLTRNGPPLKQFLTN
tara:strand:- start:8878 stop:9261 length:384 start_codon:yes stop_codon:yes gene_type:complete